MIIPSLGGRVWELEDRVRGRQWIWHREDVPLRASAMHSLYDDVWAGGWEELFPNDAPGSFEGRDLPDHGEWWTMSWSVGYVSSGAAAAARLHATSTVVKASCTKEFHLPGDDAALTLRYQVRSEEASAFHFLFKQHLPIQLTPACRLLLPGGHVRTVDPSFGTMAGPEPFSWPTTVRDQRSVDMRIVRPRSERAREFLYIRDLPEAWCGVEDTSQSASIRMRFDRREFPFVWLFLTYGGWRDAYTAVLEPCTNMPKDLSEAVRLGHSARLAPGETFQTTVSVALGGLEATAR